jgi:hypothetical protein
MLLAQVVLTARDENFGAAQLVAAVRLWHGFGSRQPQVAAGVRLGQAHGGEPFAGGDFFQIARLERVTGVVFDALVGPVQQAGCHGPAVVGSAEHLVQHGFEYGRQTLATVLGGAGQGRPAGLPKSLVSVLEAGRGGDLTVFKFATDLIAALAQRRNHFADEFASFIQHLLHQIGVHLGKGAQALQLFLRVEDVRQDETDVDGGGLVGVHKCYLIWSY